MGARGGLFCCDTGARRRGQTGEFFGFACRSDLGRPNPLGREQKKRIEEIDGIGCQPLLISATTEEMLGWIGDGLCSRALAFPEGNGAVIWPRYSVAAALNPRQAVA